MTITDTRRADPSVASMMTPEAVRDRCAQIYQKGLAGDLEHFTVHPERYTATAAFVAETIQHNYPSLEIPYHARWRHFIAGKRDLAVELLAELPIGSDERARAQFDLAISSVLVDAGAGDRWRYSHASTGTEMGRSEGLALASLDAFGSGLFSSDPDNPLQVDANALVSLDTTAFEHAFQVGAENPLIGTQGRVSLLNRLGQMLLSRRDLFTANSPRPGHLFDILKARSRSDRLPAREILIAILDAFGPIWPGRLSIDGLNLGDTWRHSAIDADGPTADLVPFHKLSQWLSYSLVEPLLEAGIEVTGLDQLTALAEYRNGGLLIDCGVLSPRQDRALQLAFAPGDEIIVEWRALTISIIDELAHEIRAVLSLDAEKLPLASILEGGTWAAGRRIAAQKRDGGGPPIKIESDGSVF